MAKQHRARSKTCIEQIKSGEVQELNLIVKGDVQGSVEAVATRSPSSPTSR